MVKNARKMGEKYSTKKSRTQSQLNQRPHDDLKPVDVLPPVKRRLRGAAFHHFRILAKELTATNGIYAKALWRLGLYFLLFGKKQHSPLKRPLKPQLLGIDYYYSSTYGSEVRT